MEEALGPMLCKIVPCIMITFGYSSFKVSCVQWRTEGGVWGVQTPPPKFRSFDKDEPNSQFRGKYIHNNLTRIRLSLIF